LRLFDKLRKIAAPQEVREGPAPADRTPEPRGLPGGPIEASQGRIWLRRESFPLDHPHGRRTLGEIRAANLEPLARAARDPRLRGADLSRAIFFDTETTSLGGGVGTWVFLLGAGWFEGERFVVEQYFLNEVTEERALLAAMNERLGSFDLAVSFHGKGFDAPRLSDRLAFHRMALRLPERHLDLCLVGRTLYRGAFPDCRLQTFERELVGFRRADDLPGAECPAAFFSHLQGRSGLIPRVFDHNLHDVLTLPAVAAAFAGEAEKPANPVVLANLGALHEAEGDDRAARNAYSLALPGLRAPRHPLLARAIERLALLERRAGRHDRSAELLSERKELPPLAVEPLEDLSKYFEHRVRDFAQAEDAAAEAFSRIVTGRVRLDAANRARKLEALEHRIERLRRKRESP
jgi:hypothetical protein